MWRTFVLAASLWSVASTSFAQPAAPIGRFVLDLRAASAALPTAEGWTPVLPATTLAPRRTLGLEVAGHVYVWHFRGAALGVGASWLRASGATSPPESTTGTPTTLPSVTTTLTSVSPQVSLNFGHALGWSYLSAGLGRTSVASRRDEAASTIQFAPRESGSVKTINYGGGARWFITDRIGVGFDVRWYKLSLVAASATHPGAPRASLLTAGAGLVLK